MEDRLEISVVVATYRRPQQLAECLAGLRAQTLSADEVIVVVNVADAESQGHVSEAAVGWSQLRSVRTEYNGTVTAYNAGLEAACHEIVAYLDDDAVPAQDWLERIERTFAADERIAAVGGRDVIDGEFDTIGLTVRFARLRGRLAVGRIQWFGRMIANHHIASGPAQDVDVIKGVNMSFRRVEVVGLGFDERLHGAGAQIHSELSICLPLRRRGLRVVYDPAIVVMHHPGPRLAGDDRGALSAEAVFESAHNEALAILDYFGRVQALVFAFWAAAIGSTEAPGIAVCVRDLIARKPASASRLAAAQRGRVAAWDTRRRQPRQRRPAAANEAANRPIGARS